MVGIPHLDNDMNMFFFTVYFSPIPKVSFISPSLLVFRFFTFFWKPT
jgi:hypothetical protein